MLQGIYTFHGIIIRKLFYRYLRNCQTLSSHFIFYEDVKKSIVTSGSPAVLERYIYIWHTNGRPNFLLLLSSESTTSIYARYFIIKLSQL
jgi:hypothetical protein